MQADRAEKLVAAQKAYTDGLLYLAFDLYRLLADDGHVESQVFVAWTLSQGIGCQKDESQAAVYYERAATHGHSLGCFYFGRWLTRAGDHARAYRFYAMGAERRHLPSMFRVGYSLAHGKGVSVDLHRSYNVLKEAAMRGHAFALRELGLQDLRGRRGVAWQPVGLVEVVAAVCWGFMVSMLNDDSEFLIS
ncbi:sel1 repeat family protein [Variovorax sp. S2]|jgi:TPR repeat protein|uniref:tetratricopeptide repeat protein n=1 Tax=Variovorax sp. S12S4 TaxID=3029170 RepID=UPI00215CDE59|nr:tetratricopeptide repeat protein [Variovorax sp. S12S4]MCR8960562.1 sel1 repeat family protein [Variovorax sp. S12S4]